MKAMSSPYVGPFFEILAGPDHTSFLAHAGVLEKSEKFNALVHGGWKDTAEQNVMLEDWDPETVGRLLEWLYTGDYESCYPVDAQPVAERPDSGASKSSVPSNPDVEHYQDKPKSESANRLQRPVTPLTDIYFRKAKPGLVTRNAEAFKQWAAKCTLTPCDFDFEARLLEHAKLYALADYMLLPTLQAEVFQRFKELLVFISAPTYNRTIGFTFPSLSTADTSIFCKISTLVRYIYANTTRLESEEEPLRELISAFAALHYDQFSDDDMDLLRSTEEGWEFSGDLHDKMQRNQSTLKKELEAVKEELEAVKKELSQVKDKFDVGRLQFGRRF